MPTWTTVENALRAWVRAGSGLSEAAVLWAEQMGARPEGAFASLRIGELTPERGAPDEVQAITDLAADPGEEIELRVNGRRELTVSVQLFGAPVTGTTALAILANVQAALALPSVVTALELAGLTVANIGAPLNVTAIKGTAFEGRAVLNVRFRTLVSLSEFTGYISTCVPVSYMGPPALGTKGNIDI